MVAKNTSQIVHIYTKNDKEKKYDGFWIFPERFDRPQDGDKEADSSEVAPTLSQSFIYVILRLKAHLREDSIDSL